MKCTMGTSPAKLTVLPVRTVFLAGQPQANISDHVSMVNLAPFGLCRSLAFPATASATAAAMGTLTPMPCVHNTPTPWMGGKTDLLIKGQPAMLQSCKCQCMWGGTISLINNGQVGQGAQGVQLPPHVRSNVKKEKAEEQHNTKNEVQELANQYIEAINKTGHKLTEQQKEIIKYKIKKLCDYVKEADRKAEEKLKDNLKNKDRKKLNADGYYIGDENLDVKDKDYWPNPNFRVGTIKLVILEPGTIIDRMAKNNMALNKGTFFGAGGTFEERCLPGEEKDYITEKFEVSFPMLAIESKVAPDGFGKIGGGRQFQILEVINRNVDVFGGNSFLSASRIKDYQKYMGRKNKKNGTKKNN